MFRKKRSASQHRPQLSSTSTQSAQSAATRAFLKSQPSSNSLSSAAAAAALRSLTPTPTPVENVQTKRMLQRKSSVSSQPVGSPTLLPTQNGLRRVNSSGSMSARTFRDQSPGRPTSSYSTMSTPAIAPPLPAIPPEYKGRRNQSRRSVSLGPSVWSSGSHTQAAELPPLSIKSPGAEPESPRPFAGSDAGTASPQHQRSESRNSINFSYPMHSRTNSPTIPAGFQDRREPAIEASHNRRPSAQTNKTGRQQTQAPVPNSPGRTSRPMVTALAAAQAVTGSRSEEPSTPPVSSRQRHRGPTAFERSPSRSPATTDVKSRPPVKKPYAPAADRQLTERPQPEPVKETVQEPVKEPSKESSKEPKSQPAAKALPLDEPIRAQTPPISEKVLRTPPVSPPQPNLTPKTNGELQPTNLRQSSSPGRSAHFPAQLAVTSLAGEHLHQPPPRSVSPAKSALKTRNSSLSPDGRVHGILRPGPPLSELSDATSVASDDGVRPSHRKKSVKVSFDDEAEVVGVAASPPTSPEEVVPESPPGKNKKTSWFSLNKRKSSPLRSVDVEEFDGVLKPRAALPSFGSIRANKDGARPEPVRQESNDNESSSDSDEEDQTTSFSNDHAIGSIISHASEEKQKQVQTDNAPSDIHINTAARDKAETLEEHIPSGESDFEPTYFHKTPLSPLQEVPSEQYLPISPNPYLDPPDITFQPATPEIERGRASLDEYNDPAEYPRHSVEEEPEAVAQDEERRASYTSEKVSDDSSSIYSDADEGYDGDGFGSINAIVGHETAPSTTATSEPESAVQPTKEKTHEINENVDADDFPETCQVAQTETPEAKPTNTNTPSFIEPLPISASNAPLPVEEDVSVPAQGIARSSTVPVEVYSIAHIHEGDDLKEVDARQSQATPNGPDAQRVASPNQGRHEPRPKRKEPNGADTSEFDLNGGGAYVPRRQLSNGSDSSSSFKRNRRANRGSMGMRLTLRGSQQSSSVPASPTRAVAPLAEAPPLPSGFGGGNMRTTLRGNNSRKEKASFFSTSKSQKGRPAKNSGGSFASRFPDSDSDSDTGAPTRRLHRPQRSMSDNDMRPVRGIPRRKGAHDGDSTELEDSSDGERHPKSASKPSARQPQPTTVRDPALAAVAKSRGMTEEELEQLLNGGSARKPSLLNRLSMRKSKPVVQRGKLQSPSALANGTISEHPQVPAQLPEATPASPSRLLKKSAQKPAAGNSWPLAGDHAEPVDSGIGSTSSASATQQASAVPSNGVTVNGNKVGGSQPAQDEEPSAEGHRASDVVIEGSGRKKRFQRLRKAFNIRG
ncbi:hypothetical protein BJY04DRAFT_198129 [Aspergillus karnatakaensis]|uniref:uncharacterized protein n=1 Tax=Aspergillus karnatakaensis TaxID=1810916 RepID=UPI003CCD3BDB